MLDVPVSERAALRPLDLDHGVFRPAPDALLATLRLTAEARWVTEYYPIESATEEPDGGLTVTLRVGDPAWLVRLLLPLGRTARLVGAGRPRRTRAEHRAAGFGPVPLSCHPGCVRWAYADQATDDAKAGRSMNIGPPEIILILLVLVLLFGAKKLPRAGPGSGRALRIFKAETKGLMDDDDDDVRPTRRSRSTRCGSTRRRTTHTSRPPSRRPSPRLHRADAARGETDR